MQKLQPVKGPDNYVQDQYGQNEIANDVSGDSEQLSPEDIHKILNAESSGGQNLQNPDSSAKGNFQFIDSTRKQHLEDLKNNQNVDIPANPDRQDALLMGNQVHTIENALQNSKTGPKEPDLTNVYLAHKYGIQGALDTLNNPNSPESKKRFSNVKKLMSKQPLTTIDDSEPAKNLLDVLKE
jgi:hypothetical protein